jgi:hypothetical protein
MSNCALTCAQFDQISSDSMNALLRDDNEAPVLTLEQIEVHLSYMRPALEAANAALPVLRDKLDALSDKVDSKLDHANRDRADGDAVLAAKIDQANKDREAGDNMLAAKIDQLSVKLDKKLDQANRDREAGDNMLAAKIDQLSANVDAKIDQANKERAAGDAALAVKLDATNLSVTEIGKAVNAVDTKLKALLWVVGVLVAGVIFFTTVGKAFHWF